MAGKIHIQELDKIVIFVTLLLMIYVFRPKRQRTTRTINQNQRFNKPPSRLGVLLAKCIVLTIMFVALNTLIDYSENIAAYENEKCNQQKHTHKHGCTFEEFTSEDLAKQIDGFLMNSEVGIGFDIGNQLNHGNSPNGPWFWLYYLLGGTVIMSGFRLANKRRKQHLQSLHAVEEKLRPIIRQLANDPRGVIEGRITMPSPVPTSKPSGKDSRRIFVIYFFSALISIITMMSFFDFFYQIDSNFSMSVRHNDEALLLAVMALGFNISGHYSVSYLSATYPGETEHIAIPQTVTSQEVSTPRNDSNKPTSARDVLKELANEMRATRIESEMLRVQLNETREKVSNLEIELEKKALELETIQALSVDMERIVKQSETPGEKNLSLMDSVLVGDALFNGDKIDKQVINDPKAIAKAAIEAYKAGRTDVKSIEFDF